MQFEQFLVTELPGLGRFAAVPTGDRHLAHDVLTDALAPFRWSRIAVTDHPAATPGPTAGAVVPGVVQLHVDARGTYSSGMQFRAPVDPDLLGSDVTVLPG